MSHKKVFFMPFDPTKNPAAVKEYGNTPTGFNKNQAMIDHELAKGNVATQVWFTGKKDPFLAGMHDGQVYIRGHGMPGANTVEGGRGGENLKYTDVVARLIKSGLPKTFTGKIKCYNCHSAETVDPTGLISREIVETHGEAFAQLLADEMFSKGYKKCTFYGYQGSIDSMPKDGTGGRHKFVRGLVKGTDGISKQVELGRVSDFRHQFKPKSMPKKPTFMGMLFGGM
ncbi:MAG: hypothetical protein V4813_15690 [Gemmatimonadota bacterium]